MAQSSTATPSETTKCEKYTGTATASHQWTVPGV
jgi:hypothetical protein